MIMTTIIITTMIITIINTKITISALPTYMY